MTNKKHPWALRPTAWLYPSLLVATQAWAQTTPDAGQLLNEQRSLTPPTIERATAPSEASADRPPLTEAPGTRVKVTEVRFTGAASMVPQADLQAAVQDFIGKPLGMAGLNAIAHRVTALLRAKGHLVAKAYLPKQDVTSGVIEVTILAGRLQGKPDGSDIGLTADGVRIRPDILQRTFATAAFAHEGQVMMTDLERGILLLQDLPGVSAQSALEAGTEPGTTRVSLKVKQAPLVQGAAWADNHGNRYTGTVRANAVLQLNSPFGLGELFSASATRAAHLTQAQLNYSQPIGHHGLRAGLSLSALDYELGDTFAALDVQGKARATQVFLSYPLQRTRQANVWARLSGEHKALSDSTLGTVVRDKRLNNHQVSFAGDFTDTFGGSAWTTWSATFQEGQLDLTRVSADEAADRLTAKAQGSYTKTQLGVARLQRLTARTSLYVAASSQFANRNLDSSEKFILGGPSGVRAYPVGEGSGDEGWLSTLEVRHELPATWQGANVQWVGFIDRGSIGLSRSAWGPAPNATQSNNVTLTGAGIGLNLNWDKRYTVRAAWATKLGHNPGRSSSGRDADGRSHSNRFWLQASISF